jgi:2-polyprenyl-6-methoxyphenol hydroxylase-like FAD-dependent oxidoreductase
MTLPQARFLELLAGEAERLSEFRLVMQANVQRLVEENGRIVGVRYRDAENKFHEIRAPLTVAADGRFSKLRHLAGIETVGTAPPMDVVWLRLSRRPSDPDEGAEIYVGGGRMAVILDRGDQWQIGFVISKGTYSSVRTDGIESVRNDLARLIPWLGDRVGELTDWKQTTVLNVESSRATTWHKPGLLLIGDAAHVMSPVGGVGINVAIQDAVAAANHLTEPLRNGAVGETDLANVQADREFAVKAVQRLQRVMQDRIASPGLKPDSRFKLPLFVRLALSIPGLRNIPGWMLAFGPRRIRWRRDLDRHPNR